MAHERVGVEPPKSTVHLCFGDQVEPSSQRTHESRWMACDMEMENRRIAFVMQSTHGFFSFRVFHSLSSSFAMILFVRYPYWDLYNTIYIYIYLLNRSCARRSHASYYRDIVFLEAIVRYGANGLRAAFGTSNCHSFLWYFFLKMFGKWESSTPWSSIWWICAHLFPLLSTTIYCFVT